MCLVTCSKVVGQAPLTGRYKKKFLWISIFVIALRNVATKMAAKTVSWLIDQLNTCAARDGGLMANVKTKYMAWFGAFI